MATIFRKLSPKEDKQSGKHEILIRFKQGNKIDQRAKSNIFIAPKYWNDGIVIKERIQTPETVYHTEAKERLNNIEDYLSKAFLDADKTNFPQGWVQEQIDRFNFPERFIAADAQEQKPDTLFEHIEKFIEAAPQRKDKETGKFLAYNNIQQYRATYKHLIAFAKSKRKKDFEFENIDQKFYDAFVTYLQGLGFTANSVGKHIRILKLMLNEAPRELREAANYDKFHVFTEDVDTVYLNEAELQQLKDTDFGDAHYLDRVRDWFLLLCWTGCRFSDLSKVMQTDIKDGFITFRQQKTNNKVTIPLHPVVLDILEKYHYQMPEAISNQRFNEYIKEAAKRAGIDSLESETKTVGGERTTKAHPKYKLISSHTGRRSFATNMYKRGLPSLMIMSVTAHRTEKSFLRYIRVTQSEHAEMMKQEWAKMYIGISV